MATDGNNTATVARPHRSLVGSRPWLCPTWCPGVPSLAPLAPLVPLVCPGFTAPHTWPGFNTRLINTYHVFVGKHVFFHMSKCQVTAVLPLSLLKAALRLGICISIPVSIATGSKGGPLLSGLPLNQARVVDQCIHVGTDI